ncbi:MAG: hypothetical protein PSN34_13070 [Urechidicola sp.]|nr:hypothetical protein [Urechidicola sp.]
MINSSKILDTWLFTSNEWNDFVSIEKENKKEDNIYLGIGILIICIPGLMLFRGTNFLTALAFSVPFALLLPFLRIKFSSPHLKNNSRGTIIKIYPNYLLINTKKIELFGKRKWIMDMKIITTPSNQKLLEFTIEWMTSKGNTNDETRIPIPKDKEQKALEIIEFYKKH